MWSVTWPLRIIIQYPNDHYYAHSDLNFAKDSILFALHNSPWEVGSHYPDFTDKEIKVGACRRGTIKTQVFSLQVKCTLYQSVQPLPQELTCWMTLSSDWQVCSIQKTLAERIYKTKDCLHFSNTFHHYIKRGENKASCQHFTTSLVFKKAKTQPITLVLFSSAMNEGHISVV